ncbi:hypothetical protein FB567DRAFT_211144 [Paraphoma chrysanthemicola]|uniref:Uncharacterized protein n=1 Tax=Paraphoma chrysanthemicola TaxID=798071 RepID=A0A8K0VSJ8_9PLEO|nr:hypothetical protein FB567DRAFT_211144 [Paraphoma chrysanthemicola]
MSAASISQVPGVGTLQEPEAEERGRLKRRRLSSTSPRRASSPSRGHERNSGSRYREHHRKHHRPSSPASSVSPPTIKQKKLRRRSDAEPDHTFRGRARKRSHSRGRTSSPLLEDDTTFIERLRTLRKKRSQPPSRHKIDEENDDDGAALRRERSHHKLPSTGRRDSKGEDAERADGAELPAQRGRAGIQQDM